MSVHTCNKHKLSAKSLINYLSGRAAQAVMEDIDKDRHE